MHCSNCGSKVDKKLRFCNNCGERLSKASEIDKDGMPGKMLDNILTTIFLIVMFGMGILVGLVAVLLGNGMRVEPLLIVVLAYLAVIFGICFTLLRQVPKLIDARLRTTEGYGQAEQPAYLRPATTAQLEEFREPAMSVTDSTTRTLDNSPLRRG